MIPVSLKRILAFAAIALDIEHDEQSIGITTKACTWEWGSNLKCGSMWSNVGIKIIIFNVHSAGVKRAWGSCEHLKNLGINRKLFWKLDSLILRG